MPPRSFAQARLSSTVSGTCSVKRCSLKVPSAPPSPLAPLSEMSITIVSSRMPSCSSADVTRPICASVCVRNPANTSCWRASIRWASGASVSHSAIQLGRAVEGRALGDDPGLELPREHLVAPPLPTAVERAEVRLDPLGGDVVRRVHRAQCEVQEERPVGRGLLLLVDVADRVVGEVLGEVVALGRGARRVDVVVVAHEVRRPVVGVALQEPVVALEPEAERPPVERPGQRALATRHQVPLADRQRVVPRVAQHPGERSRRLRHAAGVAGERHRQVGQEAHPDGVVVAPRHQARTRGRAEARHVEVVVAQTVRAKRSMCGVAMSEPKQPSWPKPRSSSTITTTLGAPGLRSGQRVVAGHRLLDRRSDEGSFVHGNLIPENGAHDSLPD